MKQTALLCALALVMVPFSARAQSVTDRASIEWGPIRDQKKDGFLSSVAHSGSHGYHLLVWRKRELALQLMDKDLRMVAECPLPLEVDRKEHKWLGLVFVDDKVHFFSSCYDRSGRTNTLYVRTYAQRDLSPIGTMRPLHTISALRKDAKGDFRVDDMGNDRIRVSVHIPIDDDDSRSRTDLLYLDDALNAVTGDANDRVMPYPSGEYDVERTVSDPDGTYLMLVRKYPDAGDRKDLSNEERYRHPLVLLTFPPGSRNATVRELDLQDKFIGEMLFLQPENDDDAIVCAGFYGNKAEHGMRGTFFLRLDRRTKEVAHRSFRELETKLVGSPVAFGEKLTKRIEAEQDQRRFLPRNIVRRADGGAALVAEQAYDYRVTETFNGRTTSTRHYVRNNILVVCADVRSEIQWVTNIPKWQSVEHTDNYGSFALAQQGEALYFLFNDRDGNIPEPTDGVGVFNLIGDDNNVTLVTLDREGSMVRELFMGSEHKPFLLIPASCKPLDDGRFFISTKNLDREMRFGFVTFD